LKYLLDTNTCIRYLNGRAPNVFKRLEAIAPENIYLCSIVKFELRYGALRSQSPEKTLWQQSLFTERFVSLPFDESACLYAAKIRAELANAGTPIGPYDLLIAGIALANGLTLVTHNTREFSRITELLLEDWEI
jgi:tRNA(fMet)-specific endonuclease VapC